MEIEQDFKEDENDCLEITESSLYKTKFEQLKEDIALRSSIVHFWTIAKTQGLRFNGNEIAKQLNTYPNKIYRTVDQGILSSRISATQPKFQVAGNFQKIFARLPNF